MILNEKNVMSMAHKTFFCSIRQCTQIEMKDDIYSTKKRTEQIERRTDEVHKLCKNDQCRKSLLKRNEADAELSKKGDEMVNGKLSKREKLIEKNRNKEK